jgi:hypothetical protein
MGGDRKEIEEKSREQWDRIVEPKTTINDIALMLVDLIKGREGILNVNNHYEGSAPLTIERMVRLLEDRGVRYRPYGRERW